MTVIDTKKLEDYLKKKLQEEVEDEWSKFGSFTPDKPPTCEVKLFPMGKWFKVEILVNYKGRTMDQTTDRLKGDPEDVHAWYDWLGLAEKIPKTVSTQENLDSWAILKAYYKITFRDVQHPGPFGFHEGKVVKSFDRETGKGVLYVVSERTFQDEEPISKLVEEPFDLNKMSK